MFVDDAAFVRRIAEGGFLEWARVLDHYYGTPVPEGNGRDLVLEIDLQGARQVRERCRDVVCVLLVAPSDSEQAARLRARGDAEDHIEARLALGERETREGRSIADAVIVNDDLDEAAREVAAIVEAARRRFASGGATN